MEDNPSWLGSFPFPKSYGQPYWCLPLCSEIAATFRLFTSSDAPTLFFLSRGNIFPIFEPNLLLKSFTGERIWAKGLRVALTFSQSIGCTCTCFTAPLFAHSEALGRLLYFGDISSLITLSVRPHAWPHDQPHDQPCPFHLGFPPLSIISIFTARNEDSFCRRYQSGLVPLSALGMGPLLAVYPSLHIR